MAISAIKLTLPDAAVGPLALEARNLSVYYGATQAVKDISMAMPARRVMALIGPSGCGKSTLLRCFNRMTDTVPTARVEGQALFHGEDLFGRGIDPVVIRRRIGMVFQRPNPFPKSIYDNVAYGPRMNGVPAAEVDRLVEESLRRAALWDEVRDRLRSSAFSLSGGQQQRMCIARALANDPEVLLLDEPTSALDPISSQKIEELLHQLKSQITVIIVTHNLQQAARISDRTAFFYMGELVEEGETKRMFTSPRESRTEAYITGRFG
jgi:phosphate transport system ATP-binding protein